MKLKKLVTAAHTSLCVAVQFFSFSFFVPLILLSKSFLALMLKMQGFIRRCQFSK